MTDQALRFLRFLTILPFISIISQNLSAQETPVREDKFYSVSGFGFAFPIGETRDYLGPKFSTSIGGLLALGRSNFFLYPKASLHAYVFDEITPDKGYTTVIKDSRATTYLASMAIGYRKTSGRLGYYGFLGGGGGLILSPRVKLDALNQIATLNNKVNGMSIIETGGGIDYGLGFTLIFFEASYMRGFGKIQDKVFQSIPITFGMKTNLSKVFYKLVK
ncbi:hypothetical protein [Pedobacter duraquae]|nr:hypothetical protein [Pedobacter duraquae]